MLKNQNLDEYNEYDKYDDHNDELNISEEINNELDDIGDIGDIEEIESTSELKISKHKIVGKHSLKYDSIFKGKKEEGENDESHPDFLVPKQIKYEFDSSSLYDDGNVDMIDYERLKCLKEQIYNLIVNRTTINIKASRRKPSKEDFNNYMKMLVGEIDTSIYSYTEIFIEFSYYFSDNICNMYRLLGGNSKSIGGKIATELSKKSSTNFDDLDFV